MKMQAVLPARLSLHLVEMHQGQPPVTLKNQERSIFIARDNVTQITRNAVLSAVLREEGAGQTRFLEVK
ncbi:hypothetical protein [Pseudarthrobacter sp. fls2-241-R2A-168]|uniref:hypothetical protein n=1 Tax=Pseudarthrobacter sp. fls2-241-R2A-168 TaxID=3040304 RepID=UPI00255225AF|nr:hypothetical protein [Pseudarthrobacter sp. fls2-241-R2A-168]